MGLLSPPLNRGMKVLDRECFKQIVKILAIKVSAKKVGLFMKSLSSELFNQPRLRNVIADADSKDTKLVLLKTDLKETEQLPEEKQELIKKESNGTILYDLVLDYDYWTADQILHAVMPEDSVDIPSSFTQVGHIAHMNLREEYYPWKTLIGQVVLDKNKAVETVVNKLNSIDTTFRFFKMEILAGKDDMIAQVKESGCTFKFDFSKVYWNSRLHTEHDRLIQQFKLKEYVCDVFAGVGPFALPAAKNGAIVYANDLNPTSYHWMKENIKANKIKTGIQPYNLDGREFIRQAVKDLQSTSPTKWKTFDHFVMNLPATSIEFLDTFRGLYNDYEGLFNSDSKLPMIHCHCFTKSADPLRDISDRVGEVMGLNPDPIKTSVHWVRNVAPKKEMYCISFPLSSEVAFAALSNDKRKRENEPELKNTTKTARTE